mmetsp:Transcript_8503/g.20159  ORF Transcript_8503/g.20159 Transcript_8503/m.20159 type:complete len:140 (-) Transcript_8503:779-1198(-)
MFLPWHLQPCVDHVQAYAQSRICTTAWTVLSAATLQRSVTPKMIKWQFAKRAAQQEFTLMILHSGKRPGRVRLLELIEAVLRSRVQRTTGATVFVSPIAATAPSNATSGTRSMGPAYRAALQAFTGMILRSTDFPGLAE